jgi:hypothetical protein
LETGNIVGEKSTSSGQPYWQSRARVTLQVKSPVKEISGREQWKRAVEESSEREQWKIESVS